MSAPSKPWDGIVSWRIDAPTRPALYDRSRTSHAVDLFDMSEKYAEVSSTDAALRELATIPGPTKAGGCAWAAHHSTTEGRTT
jgi:hypothetical protein